MGGSAVPVHLDLADEDSIIAMVKMTLDRFGKIDVLHNKRPMRPKQRLFSYRARLQPRTAGAAFVAIQALPASS